jgi:hypothetical protein
MFRSHPKSWVAAAIGSSPPKKPARPSLIHLQVWRKGVIKCVAFYVATPWKKATGTIETTFVLRARTKYQRSWTKTEALIAAKQLNKPGADRSHRECVSGGDGPDFPGFKCYGFSPIWGISLGFERAVVTDDRGWR